MSSKINTVLIADDIEQECVDILQENGISVTIKTKQTTEQLLETLPQHDAVIVRSATKITAELLAASAGKLKLVGRAGTGVDNIDVPAASANKILVMNTPRKTLSFQFRPFKINVFQKPIPARPPSSPAPSSSPSPVTFLKPPPR